MCRAEQATAARRISALKLVRRYSKSRFFSQGGRSAPCLKKRSEGHPVKYLQLAANGGIINVPAIGLKVAARQFEIQFNHVQPWIMPDFSLKLICMKMVGVILLRNNAIARNYSIIGDYILMVHADQIHFGAA